MKKMFRNLSVILAIHKFRYSNLVISPLYYNHLYMKTFIYEEYLASLGALSNDSRTKYVTCFCLFVEAIINIVSHALTFTLISTLLLTIWKAGVTQQSQLHCIPTQLKYPNRAPQWMHDNSPSKALSCTIR
jgi:hypothetical protein